MILPYVLSESLPWNLFCPWLILSDYSQHDILLLWLLITLLRYNGHKNHLYLKMYNFISFNIWCHPHTQGYKSVCHHRGFLMPLCTPDPDPPGLFTSLQVVADLGERSNELFITGFKYFQYNVSLYCFPHVSCLWNVLSSLDIWLYCFHQFGNFQPLFLQISFFLALLVLFPGISN